MRFRVGPWSYRVKIVKGLTDASGKPAAGLCNWMERTISIGAQVPARQRLTVLLHELKHAWHEAFGRPGGEEADCNVSASFAADCWRQLERQGGELALMRLDVDGIIDHGADIGEPANSTRAQCPTCGGLLNLPISRSAPVYDVEHKRLVVRRSGFCEFCDRTIKWREAATTLGVPMGMVIA